MNQRKEWNIRIGTRLKAVRTNLGFSQECFAEMINLSASYYKKLELGMYSLTIERIILLHQKFNVDPTFLLLGIHTDNDFLSMIANCESYESRNRLCQALEIGICILREDDYEKEHYHT